MSQAAVTQVQADHVVAVSVVLHIKFAKPKRRYETEAEATRACLSKARFVGFYQHAHSGGYYMLERGRDNLYVGWKGIVKQPFAKPDVLQYSYKVPRVDGGNTEALCKELTQALGEQPKQFDYPAGLHDSNEAFITKGGNLTVPSNTVIIWDWDDTLMCTTAVTSSLGSGTQIESHFEHVMEKALRVSMQLGETWIVTNGKMVWFDESSRMYAPSVRPLLDEIHVRSAREEYKASFPQKVYAWKPEVFRNLLASKNNCGLNLVVLGDKLWDIYAAHAGTEGLDFNPFQVKTVKFKEEPTCEEICEQLTFVTHKLPAIVHSTEKCLREDLAAQMQMQAFNGIHSQPAYHNFTETLMNASAADSKSAIFDVPEIQIQPIKARI